MKTKGKFIFKKSWYSYCSAHIEPDESCDRCNVGSWHNNLLHNISSYFHDHHYRLWVWFVNNI